MTAPSKKAISMAQKHTPPINESVDIALNQTLTGCWEANGSLTVSKTRVRKDGSFLANATGSFVLRHPQKHVLENLRDALSRSKIIQLKHKGKSTRRRDTMYTWTISTIPAFRDIVSRIAGNIRTPKKLKGFKRMLEKAALYLPSLTLPSQESIVTEEPNVYWIQAYESGGVVLPDVPFLDISKYVQDVGYDYWFVGFDAGDGGHHAGKGTKEGEDDRPKNHVIEIGVYQVERAVLEKIQLHYKRGAVYPTPERPVRERYFRFTSEDDVAFGLNDVLFGKHVHDNRLRQHQQMAVAFPLRFPHSKHTILYPESLREGPMHPWTMTGLADADGSFNAYFGRKENGKRTVHI